MTTRPPIGVLALQGDFREHAAALAAAGADAKLVRRPVDLTDLAGLVLPGGESTTIDKLSRAFELRDPLIAAIRGGLPTFGTCAGMILLADRLIDAPLDQQPFGGIDITVQRNGFGRQVDSFEVDLAVPALEPDPCRAVFIRAPVVVAVGAGVEVLATTRYPHGDSEAVVAVQDSSRLATAFHPEVTADLRWHQRFLSMIGN